MMVDLAVSCLNMRGGSSEKTVLLMVATSTGSTIFRRHAQVTIHNDEGQRVSMCGKKREFHPVRN